MPTPTTIPKLWRDEKDDDKSLVDPQSMVGFSFFSLYHHFLLHNLFLDR